MSRPHDQFFFVFPGRGMIVINAPTPAPPSLPWTDTRKTCMNRWPLVGLDAHLDFHLQKSSFLEIITRDITRVARIGSPLSCETGLPEETVTTMFQL